MLIVPGFISCSQAYDINFKFFHSFYVTLFSYSFLSSFYNFQFRTNGKNVIFCNNHIRAPRWVKSPWDLIKEKFLLQFFNWQNMCKHIFLKDFYFLLQCEPDFHGICKLCFQVYPLKIEQKNQKEIGLNIKNFVRQNS